MNWIKEVRLENFQSHLDTSMEFSNGLNVIVGQSDSGKTAILRGIRWVLFNQPRGTDFMRVSGDFVRVTLTFTNEVSIVRERTTSKNRYIIKTIGNEDLVLEGFGTHVPQEVLDAHQIYPLRIDRDMELLLNVSQQLDGPFLLEQTASVRAKTIGRISGAHYIDMAVRDTTKDVARLQQQTRHVENEVEILKEKIEPYHFLDDACSKLESCEQKYQQLKQKDEKLSKLELLKRYLKELSINKEAVERHLTILQGIEEWERNLERLQFIDEKKRSYQMKQTQIAEMKRTINTCKIWIEKTNGADQAKKSVTTIIQKYNQLNQLKQLYETNSRLSSSLVDARTIIDKTSFATMTEEQKVQKLLEHVKSVIELRRLDESFKFLNQQFIKIQNSKVRLEKTDLSEEKYQELLSSIERLKSYKVLKDKLVDVKKRLMDGATFVSGKKQEELQFRADYEKRLLEKGQCPTCGGQLNSTVIKQLLS
ncbi:AAA family ATPase [Alkalihalobacterium elongatum]|uniref:AAA family ATPase n=1 Tax=Alkalihalobacterium elongatum TaxID=2675466 RepID=UPI001C1F4FAE|nr:AAA family ATPase [Alkalihalobacterium elongatum]